MLIALVVAIMAYKTVPGSKDTRKFFHLLFHFMALVLSGLGLYSAFKFHKDVEWADMYSLHSWFGMAAVVLYALQVLTTISLPPSNVLSSKYHTS